jgi:hypothetical protein
MSTQATNNQTNMSWAEQQAQMRQSNPQPDNFTNYFSNVPADQSIPMPSMEDAVLNLAAAERTSGIPRSSQRKRILVLEDEPLVIMIADALLTQMGHSVTTAMAVAEAQGSIVNAPSEFDILFVDLNLGEGMPGGLEFAKVRGGAHTTGRPLQRCPLPPRAVPCACTVYYPPTLRAYVANRIRYRIRYRNLHPPGSSSWLRLARVGVALCWRWRCGVVWCGVVWLLRATPAPPASTNGSAMLVHMPPRPPTPSLCTRPPPVNPPSPLPPLGCSPACPPQWMRDREKNAGRRTPVPIMAVTGKTVVNDLSALSGVVAKPYEMNRLRTCIEKWCVDPDDERAAASNSMAAHVNFSVGTS